MKKRNGRTPEMRIWRGMTMDGKGRKQKGKATRWKLRATGK